MSASAFALDPYRVPFAEELTDILCAHKLCTPRKHCGCGAVLSQCNLTGVCGVCTRKAADKLAEHVVMLRTPKICAYPGCECEVHGQATKLYCSRRCRDLKSAALKRVKPAVDPSHVCCVCGTQLFGIRTQILCAQPSCRQKRQNQVRVITRQHRRALDVDFAKIQLLRRQGTASASVGCA